MCEDLDRVRSWADVILLLYSVTDSDTYITATLAHKHINNINNNQPNRKVAAADRRRGQDNNNNNNLPRTPAAGLPA